MAQKNDGLNWNYSFPNDESVHYTNTLFTNAFYLFRSVLKPEQEFNSHAEWAAIIVAYEVVITGTRIVCESDVKTHTIENGVVLFKYISGRYLEPFDIRLMAIDPGDVNIEVTLYVNGGVVLRREISLRAITL